MRQYRLIAECQQLVTGAILPDRPDGNDRIGRAHACQVAEHIRSTPAQCLPLSRDFDQIGRVLPARDIVDDIEDSIPRADDPDPRPCHGVICSFHKSR